MTVLDTPEKIAFAKLVAIRGALKLELVGVRATRGRTGYALAKDAYGLKGNRVKVLAQLERMILIAQHSGQSARFSKTELKCEACGSTTHVRVWIQDRQELAAWCGCGIKTDGDYIGPVDRPTLRVIDGGKK